MLSEPTDEIPEVAALVERGPYNVETLTGELLTMLGQISPTYLTSVLDYLRELSVLEVLEPAKSTKGKRR